MSTLKQTLEKHPYLIDEIDNLNFDEVYRILDARARGEFTSVMVANNINPLNHTAKIGMPSSYALNSTIDKIDIPKNITVIKSNAYRHCNNLTSVDIPQQIKQIDWRAFSYCDNLEQIRFNSTIDTVPSECCVQCGKLKQVNLNKVQFIGDHAFAYCRELTRVEMSKELDTIGEYAFYRCEKLRKISLPTSITRIEAHAFADCALCDIAIGIIYYDGTVKMWDQIDIHDSAFGYKQVLVQCSDGHTYY